MAYGGRGRGRGRGPGGFGFLSHAVQEPFILFPEDVELPSKPKASPPDLIRRKNLLERFWRTSPYYIQDKSTNSKNQHSEVERYSDRNKPQMNAKREPLSYYLKLTSAHFPVELLQGSKRLKHKVKNLQWDNEEIGLKKMDVFAKLEAESQKEDTKTEKSGKDEANDGEEDEDKVEEESEDSDDGDYNQNIDFDDDEDDLNIEEDDEGPCY